MTGALALLLGVGVATAGEVFFVDPYYNEVVRLELRTMTSSVAAPTGFVTEYSGLAYDAQGNQLWLISTGPFDSLRSIDLRTLRNTNFGPQHAGITELSFDTISHEVFGYSRYGIFLYPSYSLVFDPGINFGGADWFSDGGYSVAIDGDTGEFVAIDHGLATVVAPVPGPMAPLLPFGHQGLAYDDDTNILIVFSQATPWTWLIDPETFSVVGKIVMDRTASGAGGSIDNVPAQTPELLVTGDCPGTMYITAVDATPGGHVQIGSSAAPGTKTLTGGPCSGTRLDLRRPAFRADLVANSYGIASTTIQATAPMCGNVLVQALDVGTCMTTSVRTVDWAVY